MPKTLLAVDDSATIRKAIEITFSGEDFNVVPADSKDAALAGASGSPDLVLVDSTMGGGDGYAIAKELRGKLPKATILMMASRYNPYDASKGTDAGVDDFFDKPFDTQQVLDKAKKAMVARESGAPVAAAAPAAKPAAAAAPAAAPAAAAAAAASNKPRAATLMFGASPVAMPGRPDPAVTPAAGSPKPEVAAAKPAAAAPAAAPAATSPAAASVGAAMTPKLTELGLSKEQVEAVLALSREIVEKVVWEVVPQLAEAMIREEITRLTKDA